MSVSFSPVIHKRRTQGSSLLISGMLIAAVLVVAFSVAFGMGSPDASAMIVGP